ncbi:MFS transporter [Streptomyces filipinensis]|uniref:MFS transporter n=1 Tax=Streptomyces filipinensis TaxID=66887 RepID=A0A918I5P1_9ACTN|nr:MFS transporter [Streptomyces filipinensis]GGU76378.1 MFS transporter [Streptomyces filipinensis]
MYRNLGDVLRGRRAALLAAAAVAQFVVALDMAVVNVALPAIRDALGFAPLDLSWVVHVYALTFGGFLLLGGRACDLYGPRRLFVAGLVVFGACSLAGGLAQEPWQLVAARAGQGVGAAATAPAALALLTTTFTDGPARVRALGVWSGMNALGGALGVLAGGVLTQYAGWRWVMLVNLPIVAAALVLVHAAVPSAPRPVRREAPDALGALLATGGTGLLVFGVVRTDVQGWGSRGTLAALGGSALVLAAFVLVESRATSPLLRLGLLRSRWVAGADLLVFLAAAGQFASFYFVSLYLQQVLGLGAAATGAAFLPFCAGSVAATVAATRITATRSPRTALVPGALLAAAGMAWFARISPHGGFLTDVLGPSLLTSVGIGLVFAPAAAAATTGVRPGEAGMASGLLNSARQLGGCIGVATLATVAARRTGASTDPGALSDGYALALAVTAVLFLLAAAVAVFVLPRRPDRRPAPSTGPGTGPGAAPPAVADTPAAPPAKRMEGTPS